MTAHPPGSHTLANARIAARKIGASLEDYLRERAAGRRWCSRCRSWRAHVHRGWCSPCRHGRVPVERPARPAPPPRPVLTWTDPRSPWMAEVEVETCDEGPGHRWGRAPRVTGRAGAETTGRARPETTAPDGRPKRQSDAPKRQNPKSSWGRKIILDRSALGLHSLPIERRVTPGEKQEGQHHEHHRHHQDP